MTKREHLHVLRGAKYGYNMSAHLPTMVDALDRSQRYILNVQTTLQTHHRCGDVSRKPAKRCELASSSLEGEEYSDGSNAALPSFVHPSVVRRMGTVHRSSSNGDLLMSGGIIVSRIESWRASKYF